MQHPRQQVEHGIAPIAGTQCGRRQRRYPAACHLQPTVKKNSVVFPWPEQLQKPGFPRSINSPAGLTGSRWTGETTCEYQAATPPLDLPLWGCCVRDRRRGETWASVFRLGLVWSKQALERKGRDKPTRELRITRKPGVTAYPTRNASVWCQHRSAHHHLPGSAADEGRQTHNVHNTAGISSVSRHQT